MTPHPSSLRIEAVTTALPDLDGLSVAAEAEGLLFVARLRADWASGAVRFDRPGELLLAARCGPVLAGIGGMTREPSASTMLRMRRFYILPPYRRIGIARALAGALLSHAEKHVDRVTVHAGSRDAARFWEALGFTPLSGRPYSHQKRLR